MGSWEVYWALASVYGRGPKALGEDTVMVPIIRLDPLGRPKEARLFSARQEGPKARGAVAWLPGSAVTAPNLCCIRRLHRWKWTGGCHAAFAVAQGQSACLSCLAPIQGGLLVCVRVAPLQQTGLGFAGAQTPLGCGPEVSPAAAGAPCRIQALRALGPCHNSLQQPSQEGIRDLLFSCEH